MHFYRHFPYFAYTNADVCASITNLAYKYAYCLISCTVVSTQNVSNRRTPLHVRNCIHFIRNVPAKGIADSQPNRAASLDYETSTPYVSHETGRRRRHPGETRKGVDAWERWYQRIAGAMHCALLLNWVYVDVSVARSGLVIKGACE